MANGATARKRAGRVEGERIEVSARDVRAKLSDLINRAEYAGDVVVITRRGKPIAALVGTRDLALLDGAA